MCGRPRLSERCSDSRFPFLAWYPAVRGARCFTVFFPKADIKNHCKNYRLVPQAVKTRFTDFLTYRYLLK